MSGPGIFTTIAIRSSAPFLWEKHWSRLVHAADKLSIDLSAFPEAVVKDTLMLRLGADSIQNGRTKVTFTDERPSRLWPVSRKAEANTSLSIVTGPIRELPAEFRVGISPYPVNSRSPLAGLKTTNYLEQTLCFEAAKAAGVDEAIRVNERGQVTSGCFSNVFWIKDVALFTPDLSTGCLAGTTREFVIENLDVREVSAGIDELLSADAVFLTSAGIGIIQAVSLAETDFDGKAHAILTLIEN